jgi:hypothetical protein
MTLLPFDYATHEATLAELTSVVLSSLADAEKRFLLSFESGSPDWSLFPVAGADSLPAPRWKLLNIQKLRSANPAKHTGVWWDARYAAWPGSLSHLQYLRKSGTGF